MSMLSLIHGKVFHYSCAEQGGQAQNPKRPHPHIWVQEKQVFPWPGKAQALTGRDKDSGGPGDMLTGVSFCHKTEGKKHKIILDRRWDSTAQRWPSIELTGLGSIGPSHTMACTEIRQSKQAGERPPARVSAAISQAQRRWQNQQQGASQTHHINLG